MWAGVVPLSLRVGELQPEGPVQSGPGPWEEAPGRAFDEVLKSFER